MSNQIFGVDPDNLDDADFVGSQLAGSALVHQIVDIVAPDTLTTDEAVGVSVAVDMSGSMSAPQTVDAVVRGYNTMLDTLATTSERRQMFLQAVVYDTKVKELHTFQRLVDPKDNKTLNVPYLDKAKYNPGKRGGRTASIDAVMKVAADNRYFEQVLGLDDVDVSSRHVIVLITDGFVNEAPKDGARQLRDFVRRHNLTESWTFLVFCIADQSTADVFARHLRSATNFQGSSEDAAQIMFEAMATGWGYWINDPGQIDSIPDPDDRKLAQLYLEAEQIIVKHFDPTYKGRGGLGVPRGNVLTVWHNPQSIVEMIGAQVSNSIIRASQGRITAVSATTPNPNNSGGGGSVF